ncbi:MAG: 30S ribosomal protein S5 alanine N-acetyltransferase [Burkholderiales bacterium PBB3]|nr:MAG: 30S ribosomal protein S5 alanine N-acetyltransferase [Burkholderiales bacterium PBB3]
MDLPELRTPRCVLTLLRPEHANAWLDYRIHNAAHLGPWEPARDSAEGTLEQVTARKAEMSLQAFEAGTAVQFLALDAATGVMVAACNFTNIVRGPLQACYLGYSVAEYRQGQGLGYEVVQAGMAYMFGTCGLHRIMANHMPSNTRSAALLQRLGFEREGYARQYLKIAGRWEDMVLNARINPQV